MVIIENKSQLRRFIKHYKSEDCIIVPISCDDNKHPINDSLSLLYVKLLSGKEFILPFNHSETLNLKIPSLDSNTKKYTYNRKKLNHYIKLTNVIDVNLMHYMNEGSPITIEETDTNSHNFLNMKYYKKDSVNTIIPVLKHLEKSRKIAKILEEVIAKHGSSVNMSYNDEVLDNLSYIEKNGLQTIDDKVYS